MSRLPANTPLYNHPLPEIESWLIQQGCHQNPQNLNFWSIQRPHWQAEIELDMDQLVVRYLKAGEGGKDIQRAFKYSLSREDIENAVFCGP